MKPSNGVPSAAEFGLNRAFLAQQGVSQATITEYMGTNVGGRDRATINETIKEMCKSFPKAV